MPPDIPLMFPTAGIPPSVAGWVAEPKLDGWRGRLLADADCAFIRTRRGNDVSEAVPAALAVREAGLRVVLDGELVSGSGIEELFGVAPALARERQGQPVTFVAFDVLWHDGDVLTGRSYTERRAVLDGLGLDRFGVPVVASLDVEDATSLFSACSGLGVGGVVLKRSASRYRPGRRTPDWKKTTCSAWRDHLDQLHHSGRREHGTPDET
jgi:bifunctional non-homologous end joining protein LigD